MNFFDQFNANYSVEAELAEDIKKIESTPEVDHKNLLKLMGSYDSIYSTIALKKNPISHYYATEEDGMDEDPFSGLGDGLDDTGEAAFTDNNSGDVNFDSFDDQSGGDGGVFDDWGMGGGDTSETDETRAKALEVSRSDLLDETYNLGAHVRRVVPGKIKNLISILENNITIITNHIYDNKYTEDFKFIKDSYQDILNSLDEYLDVIDSKTFDDIFADYVTFLSLIDSVNGMYEKVTQTVNKTAK